MRKTPLYQGKEQPLKKHVANAAAALVKVCSGRSCSPGAASSTGHHSHIVISNNPGWSCSPGAASSTGSISTHAAKHDGFRDLRPDTAPSTGSVSTHAAEHDGFRDLRLDTASSTGSVSTGSVQTSVYIQMFSQHYSPLKCFQDFKAIHVSIYHCHTPLLFLKS